MSWYALDVDVRREQQLEAGGQHAHHFFRRSSTEPEAPTVRSRRDRRRSAAARSRVSGWPLPAEAAVGPARPKGRRVGAPTPSPAVEAAASRPIPRNHGRAIRGHRACRSGSSSRQRHALAPARLRRPSAPDALAIRPQRAGGPEQRGPALGCRESPPEAAGSPATSRGTQIAPDQNDRADLHLGKEAAAAGRRSPR